MLNPYVQNRHFFKEGMSSNTYTSICCVFCKTQGSTPVTQNLQVDTENYTSNWPICTADEEWHKFIDVCTKTRFYSFYHSCNNGSVGTTTVIQTIQTGLISTYMECDLCKLSIIGNANPDQFKHNFFSMSQIRRTIILTQDPFAYQQQLAKSVIVCQCGTDKHGWPKHADWCDKGKTLNV